MENLKMEKIIAEIEQVVLQWDETSAEAGDFEARSFLFHKEEFGHIHSNGDLDIVFGESITTQLLQKKLVQRHRYVPKVGITYVVLIEEGVPFAISLLRFSYLRHFIKANGDDADSQRIFESELAKLPNSLK